MTATDKPKRRVGRPPARTFSKNVPEDLSESDVAEILYWATEGKPWWYIGETLDVRPLLAEQVAAGVVLADVLPDRKRPVERYRSMSGYATRGHQARHRKARQHIADLARGRSIDRVVKRDWKRRGSLWHD